MKNQQKTIEFLSLIITLFCKMYYINKIIKNDINYDIIINKRYYYQILNIKINYVNKSKITRQKYLK